MDFPAYVPGFAVEAPLGADGTVWAGREDVSGTPVALRLLPLADPAARERARREVALLTAVDHPHVLPLLGVVDVPGGLILVLELAEGGSLDDLLAARGTLTPGEVVTACAPIAQALAELHGNGIVHGRVSPASVLFAADGRPMLADLGTGPLADGQPGEPSRIVPPEVQAGYPPHPGSDVYALAAVAVRALTGYVPNQALILPGIPPATQSALAQAMHPDPARRPAAASLANALFVLADPEPVVFTAPTAAAPLGEQSGPADVAEEAISAPRSRRAARRAQTAEATSPDALAAIPAPAATIDSPPLPPEVEPEPRRRRRRRLRRVDLARIAMVVAIPVILAGAVFAALQWWGDDGEPESLPGANRLTSPGEAEIPVDLCGGPQPAPTEQPPEVADWTQVVQSLYLMRAQAFNEVDAQALCDVYAATSQVLADDAELLQLYADAGVHTQGLAFEVITAELVSQEGGRVVLEITDRLPPYQLVDADGTVKAEKEGLPEATWEAELVPASDASGWRFG
ncbi:MAG TPA: serine/threonine-protein kinase [Jiangellaceae bacterium]|jgi:serine/threonine protein kinase|nr:serine/threonine-protein kinase [Jiangellaceae bacterium]